jgi:hypothetical protein
MSNPMNRPFALITGASSWNRRGVGRDLRTRREKHNAADVARVGFDAMMRGDGDVVSGWKNKLQAAIANITSAGALAGQHHKMAEPGSGAKGKD